MRLLTIILISLMISLPTGADPVVYTSIIDSTPNSQSVIFIDRWGRLKEQKLTVYTYLTQDGKKVELPYKIQHLRDDRIFSKKHPLIYAGVGMAVGPLAGYSSSIIINTKGVGSGL